MSEEVEDRSDEQLTPQEAYNLTVKQNIQGKTVAKMFGISPARVSQLKKEYEKGVNEGRQEGRNSVSANDFDKETLENALKDKKKEEDTFECSECGKEMDYMEYKECPNCGAKLGWSKLI